MVVMGKRFAVARFAATVKRFLGTHNGETFAPLAKRFQVVSLHPAETFHRRALGTFRRRAFWRSPQSARR